MQTFSCAALLLAFVSPVRPCPALAFDTAQANAATARILKRARDCQTWSRFGRYGSGAQ